MRFFWVFVVIGIVFVCMSMSDVCAEDEQLPLWPCPQELLLMDGEFDVSGGAINLPADAGEKSMAVASALSVMLKRHLSLRVAPEIVRSGLCKSGGYVLSVGIGAEAWERVEQKLVFDDITESLRDQAYVLEITTNGVVIAASAARGLYYGAVTFIQLARCSSEGTRIPCLTIRDWPDLEIRGVHVTNLSVENRELGAASALDGKINMLVWENHKEGFSWEEHPELMSGQGAFSEFGRDYELTVQKIRSLGIEVVPLRNLALGHSPQSGLYPYSFLGDNETYYWAIKEIIDAELEIFTPRYFHLGMDEEKLVKKRLYPSRTMTQWRDVAVECATHLRRRGVMGMIWTEMLFPKWGGQNKHYDWEKCVGKPYPGGYYEFTATFPGDLIFVPWFYWTKTPEDTLGEKGGVRAQAKTGNPIIVGAYETHVLDHAAAVRMIKPDRPNVLGVVTTSWGGRELFMDEYPRYAEYIRRASGPFWNHNVTGVWPPKVKVRIRSPFWNDGTGREERFTWPEPETSISNLACLLDADPPKSTAEAIGRLKNDDWLVWTDAREELVAAGFDAAPMLLDAMSKADDEIQERIEGCLSRNARDARNGRKRGKLNVSKVALFLSDKNEIVRDMAAEVLASFGEQGVAMVRAMIKDTEVGASCIRALRIARDRSSVRGLIDIVGDTKAAVRSRVEAARLLGILRIKKSEVVLRGCLVQGTDKDLQKAALWSLALIQCLDAEKEIAVFLDSKDDDLRFRAATALTILKSGETKKLVPWLSKDRHSLEVAAWSMWKTWKDEDACNAFKSALKTQKDEISRQRLDMLIKKIDKKGDKAWRY